MDRGRVGLDRWFRQGVVDGEGAAGVPQDVAFKHAFYDVGVLAGDVAVYLGVRLYIVELRLDAVVAAEMT